MDTSTVYVVQKRCRLTDRGQLVPKFDLTQAEQYGQLKYLLPPTAGPFRPLQTIELLRAKLANFTDRDYLLLVGNPCLIAWASIVAAERSRRLNLLQWSSKQQRYLPIHADIK